MKLFIVKYESAESRIVKTFLSQKEAQEAYLQGKADELTMLKKLHVWVTGGCEGKAPAGDIQTVSQHSLEFPVTNEGIQEAFYSGYLYALNELNGGIFKAQKASVKKKTKAVGSSSEATQESLLPTETDTE